MTKEEFRAICTDLSSAIAEQSGSLTRVYFNVALSWMQTNPATEENQIFMYGFWEYFAKNVPEKHTVANFRLYHSYVYGPRTPDTKYLDHRAAKLAFEAWIAS